MMTREKRVRGFVALGLCILMTGGLGGACMAPSASERDTLTDDVRGFHDGLRWRRFGDTAGRMLPAERERFLERVRKLKEDFQVDDYEVVRTEPIAPGYVYVTVVMEWESLRAGVLRKSELREKWQRMGKRWMMVEPTLVGDVSFPLLGLSATDKPAVGAAGAAPAPAPGAAPASGPGPGKQTVTDSTDPAVK